VKPAKNILNCKIALTCYLNEYNMQQHVLDYFLVL